MRRLLVALFVILAFGVSASAATPREYFANDGSRDAIFMDFVAGPQAIEVGTRTYIAYQGPALAPHIMAWDKATGRWIGPYRAGTNPLTTDTHGAPALWRDSSGYLHIIYGAHGRALRQSRSVRPDDPSAWVDETPPGAPEGTYPRILRLSGGRIGLFYRSEDTGARDWSLRVSTNGGRTWGPPRMVLDAVGDDAWYASARSSTDGSVIVSFVRQDYARFYELRRWSRFDVHWLRIAPDGSVRNAAGTQIDLPLTWATAASRCRAIPTSDYANHSIGTLDASGAPVMLYLRGSGAGSTSYRWCFARYESGAWTEREICRTDHYYDTASMRVAPDGRIEAALVTGGTDGRGTGDWDHTDRGGAIVRFASADGGVTWSREQTVSPQVPSTLHNQPMFVEGAASRLVFSEWENRPSIDAYPVYLWDADGFKGRDFGARVGRVSAPDRFTASVALSRRAFPSGAPVAFLVNADAPADALAVGALAAKAGGPILLVRASGASAAVRAEIARLRAAEVVAVGGPASIPATVLASATSKWTEKTSRIAGADRFETAAAIARRLKATQGARSTTAVVVNGRTLVDGLAAAPLASTLGAPVLLTDGPRVPPAMRSALAAWGATSTIVLGGRASVPDSVMAALPQPTRIGGRDRTEVAANAAEYGLMHGALPRRGVLANGWALSDGLTAGVLAARLRGPVLLTSPASLSTHAERYLVRHRSDMLDLWCVGGDASMPAALRAEAARALSH